MIGPGSDKKITWKLENKELTSCWPVINSDVHELSKSSAKMYISLFVRTFLASKDMSRPNRTFSSSSKSQKRSNNIVFLYSQTLGSNSKGYNFEIFPTYLYVAISSYYLSICSIIWQCPVQHKDFIKRTEYKRNRQSEIWVKTNILLDFG